jgi:cyclohexyl-isocyanide hydratase
MSNPTYTIVVPLYDGVDLLDIAAPTEVFTWLDDYWEGAKVIVRQVAECTDSLKTRDGTIITPQKTFAEVPRADLVWVPGGQPDALAQIMYKPGGAPYLDYLRQIADDAKWVTSVCEGALLLAQAGLLDGYFATTHWRFQKCLSAFPKIKVVTDGHRRYIIDRNRVTGAGISAGLDEALALVELIAGTEVARQVQLTLQYYPRPPVDGPIPEDPGDCLVESP